MNEENISNHNKNPFTRKLLFIAIPIFVVVLAWFVLVVKDRVFPPPKFHSHAGFILVKNNQLVSFTDIKFMKISPCSKDAKMDDNETPAQAQKEKAHLHDNIGDVVHMEKAGAQWKDLFTNINYPINYQTSTAYINGKKINDFQAKPILPNDSAVIFDGTGNDESKFLSQAVSKDHITEIAKKSESCGS